MPYTSDEIKFVPQLFYKLYLLPFGIQSTQIHINYWDDNDFINFKKFIEKNHNKIIKADFAFSKTSNSYLYKVINFTLKKVLRFKKIYILNLDFLLSFKKPLTVSIVIELKLLPNPLI